MRAHLFCRSLKLLAKDEGTGVVPKAVLPPHVSGCAVALIKRAGAVSKRVGDSRKDGTISVNRPPESGLKGMATWGSVADNETRDYDCVAGLLRRFRRVFQGGYYCFSSWRNRMGADDRFSLSRETLNMVVA